jgi:hypothetical protein
MDQINQEEGIVYILTNLAMPGLVKIGGTARGSVTHCPKGFVIYPSQGAIEESDRLSGLRY